jgi:hypothetical protein
MIGKPAAGRHGPWPGRGDFMPDGCQQRLCFGQAPAGISDIPKVIRLRDLHRIRGLTIAINARLHHVTSRDRAPPNMRQSLKTPLQAATAAPKIAPPPPTTGLRQFPGVVLRCQAIRGSSE